MITYYTCKEHTTKWPHISHRKTTKELATVKETYSITRNTIYTFQEYEAVRSDNAPQETYHCEGDVLFSEQPHQGVISEKVIRSLPIAGRRKSLPDTKTHDYLFNKNILRTTCQCYWFDKSLNFPTIIEEEHPRLFLQNSFCQRISR